MARMARTAGEYAAAIDVATAAARTRRPDGTSWSAGEVLCHVRDIEEAFLARFQSILASERPWFTAIDPDRWATDRQYARNDPVEALAAFRRRREQTLALLGALEPAHWERSGLHATRGPMSIADLVSLLAGEDDNHLDQLRRALAGRP